MYAYIFIYLSMLGLIFLHMFPCFSIYQDAYVNVNSLYINFLYNIFLPDVSPSSKSAFMILSLLLSVPFTLLADDVANKV